MELLWTSFIALMIVLVLVDLFVLRRPSVPESTTRSIGFATLWLVVAMAFNGVVYWIYHTNFWGAGKDPAAGTVLVSGPDASLQFLSSYVLEWVLNIDSVFVIAAVFAHFNVREEHRHRLLMWGLLIALVFRGGLILTIGSLIHHLGWIRFVLAGVLVIAAIRMILIRQENLDPNKSYVFRAIKWILPVSKRQEGSNLITTEQGKPALTPLVVPLLLIETADVFLAMDSIPASFAFTREPFLIFCASALAMLSVRSMMGPLSRIIQRLRYFKIGQAMLLAYSAVIITMPVSQTLANMQTPGWSLTPLKKLAFVGVAMISGIVIAWALGGESLSRGEGSTKVSPLGPDADRFARTTLTHIRKIFVFVFGITGVIVGLVMAIGPGPGIPVLFIALLVLASEFVWARVLVTKYRKIAEVATMKAAAEARKRFRPWVLIGLISAEVIAATLIAIFTKVPTALAITAVVPLIAGQLFLGYLAYIRKPDVVPPTQDVAPPPPPPPSPNP